MKNKTAKAFAAAAVATVLTGCAGTASNRLDTLGEVVGMKGDATTIVSPVTQIKYDAFTGSPKPAETTLDACNTSTASRFGLVPLLQEIQTQETALNNANSMKDKIVARGKLALAEGAYLLPKRKFVKATQDCIQDIANKMATNGDWSCKAGSGTVEKADRTLPSSPKDCAVNPTKAQSNFFNRQQSIKNNDYNQGGKVYKNPSLIR